jgi:hypothetical protein
MDGNLPFTIVDQQHSEQINDKGQLVGTWRITFQTPSDIRAFVDIPDDRYTAQNVHAMVAWKVATIEQVQRLDGTPPAEQQ